MTGKRRHYILTETAKRDFREARRWSLSRRGKELTKQYFFDLHESAENTELSVHPVRQHYLVYVPIKGNCIVIVALIRQTRDVPAILNANSFMIQRQLKAVLKKLEQGAIPNLAK